MRKKLRIGIMGCADIADRMVIPAIKSSNQLELVAVASRSAEKANAYALKFQCEAIVGYEELIARHDIDVIYMPLPTSLHLEWATKAARAGKHLLIEKSLAPDLDSAEKIVQQARVNKVLVMENFMFQHHEQIKFIQGKISDGFLGEIRNFRSSFGFPPFPDKGNIRYQKELAGGALLDAGAYTLKIASLLLNEKLTVDAANLHISQGKGVDIFGSISLHTDSGISVQNAFGFDHFYQCELEIWGSKGKLTATRVFTAGPGVQPEILLESKDGRESIKIPTDNHFINLLNFFSDSIINNLYFEDEYEKVLRQSELLEFSKNKALRFNCP